jgi:transposase-like protein
MPKAASPRPLNTLLDAVRRFADPQVAHDHFVKVRWPNGVACPRNCGSVNVQYMPKHRRWYCRDCKGQFTAKVGTIFEDSPIGFDKWLPAVWLIASNRNGVSSCELARSLHVTQKTAWFMLHRIREGMANPHYDPLSGPVEADETYVGGLTKNMNKKRRARFESKGPGASGKAAVFGIVERNTAERKGKIRAFVIPFVDREALQGGIREHVEPGSEVHTDGFPAYRGLSRDYVHQVIDHAYEYVRGNVHTNSIESFFSVLKRTIKGTYVAPRPEHLRRYVEEQVFRFNAREDKDGERFPKALAGAEGSRLTYKTLTRKLNIPG